MAAPVLALNDISKAYPGVLALSGVSLGLVPGEVLGLVGENGAGKSTLIKIITGAIQPDSGTITLNGTQVVSGTPSRLLELGVSAIYQEFSLFPELTVAQNLFYGREQRRGPFLDHRAMTVSAREQLDIVGAEIDPNEKVKNLSIGHQQLVELAKAISRNARVLIMDEPTAPLTNHEVTFLYAAVRALSARGVAIIYVSHRLEEIFDLCDRVVVLRDGRQVDNSPIGELDRDRLIRLMVGRSLDEEFPPSRSTIGEVTLDVRDLRSDRVNGVTFTARQGEIVGLGGLVGAGRTECVRLIFGADRRTAGDIFVNGTLASMRSPRSAMAAGLGLIPEDRKHQGVLLNQSIRFNVAYAALRKFTRVGFVATGVERKAASDAVAQLRIRTPSTEQTVGSLSGGNQQKVVVAKWLETNANILIFDEPTRGIDVGAKQEIYRLMRDLSAAGKTIIMISSEMPELLGMSDRLIVLHEGRSVAELTPDQFDPARVLQLASGINGKAQ